MAKKIEGTDLYEPGVIYELQYYQDNKWIPFYVGESYRPDERLKEHRGCGSNATDTSTLVYQTIKKFDELGIQFDMFIVDNYDHTGPKDLEDEHIMRLLLESHTLMNEKKGNAKWMTKMQSACADMKRLKISSYRKYRQYRDQLCIEQRYARKQQRHAKWIKEHYIKRIFILEEKVQYGVHLRTKKEYQTWNITDLIDRRTKLVHTLLQRRQKKHKEIKKDTVLQQYRSAQKQAWQDLLITGTDDEKIIARQMLGLDPLR